MIVGDELLHRLVMTEISKIAEDGHESLRFEWIAVDVDLCRRLGLIEDTFVLDLVREEGCDDGEETGHEVVASDDVESDGRDCEKLEGKVFNGGLCFAIDQQVGIHYAVVHIRKMASYRTFSKRKMKKKAGNIPTASLCCLLRVSTDA